LKKSNLNPSAPFIFCDRFGDSKTECSWSKRFGNQLSEKASTPIPKKKGGSNCRDKNKKSKTGALKLLCHSCVVGSTGGASRVGCCSMAGIAAPHFEQNFSCNSNFQPHLEQSAVTFEFGDYLMDRRSLHKNSGHAP